MSLVLSCQACGEPMPPLPEDLAAIVRSGRSVAMTHDVCPRDRGTSGPPDGLRYFEARVSIVEVTPRPDLDGPPETTVLADFKAGVAGVDFAAAVRPLALAVGEKWSRVEEHAAIADPKAAVNQLPPASSP